MSDDGPPVADTECTHQQYRSKTCVVIDGTYRVFLFLLDP